MKILKLERKLQKSKDKLSIFRNKKILNKFNFNEEELNRLIKIYLTDEQKAELFEIDHFRNLRSYQIKDIIELIKDDRLKLKLLKDDELMSGMTEFDIVYIINLLKDEAKMEVLKDTNYREKYNIDEYHIKNIIVEFTNDNKKSLLLDKDFVEKELKIGKNYISMIVASLESEDEKIKFIDEYEFGSYELSEILCTFSDEYKKVVLLENKFNLMKYEINAILISMETNAIINFINENEQFCAQNGIEPYVIMAIMDSKKQLEFIQQLENIERLTIRRKETSICKVR